jgi:hypothetical protein
LIATCLKLTFHKLVFYKYLDNSSGKPTISPLTAPRRRLISTELENSKGLCQLIAMEDIKPPLGALVVIPGCAQNPLEPKQSQTKPLEEFHLFSKLPIELRLKIWGYTIIPRDNDLAVKPFDLVPSDIPPTRIEDITANHPNRFIEDGMYDEDDGTLNYSGGYCLMCDLSLDELRAQQDPFPIALRICRESRAQALTQCTLYKQTPLWNILPFNSS